MYKIEIDNTKANQKFTINTEQGTLEIKIRTVEKITLLSVSTGEKDIVRNIKVVPNLLLLAYKNLQKKFGDFVFSTVENKYPYYINFSKGNNLYWLDTKEVEEYKNANTE